MRLNRRETYAALQSNKEQGSSEVRRSDGERSEPKIASRNGLRSKSLESDEVKRVEHFTCHSEIDRI